MQDKLIVNLKRSDGTVVPREFASKADFVVWWDISDEALAYAGHDVDGVV